MTSRPDTPEHVALFSQTGLTVLKAQRRRVTAHANHEGNLVVIQEPLQVLGGVERFCLQAQYEQKYYINTAVTWPQLRWWMSRMMHVNHHPDVEAPLGRGSYFLLTDVSQEPEQSLAPSRCSLNTCWVDECYLWL